MKTNLFRKGLAIGATVALGISALVSVPAQAIVIDAGAVSLDPVDGKGYNVLATNGANIEIISQVSSTTRAGSTTGLKWLITDPDEILDVTDEPVTRQGDGSLLVDPIDFAEDFTLELIEDPGTDYSVTVTAWFDDLDNDVIGANEKGNTATVNFYQASSVAISAVVTKPIVGDTEFEGYIVTTPELNVAYSEAPEVAYTIQGSAATFLADVSTDAENTRWEFIANDGGTSTVTGVSLADLADGDDLTNSKANRGYVVKVEDLERVKGDPKVRGIKIRAKSHGLPVTATILEGDVSGVRIDDVDIKPGDVWVPGDAGTLADINGVGREFRVKSRDEVYVFTPDAAKDDLFNIEDMDIVFDYTTSSGGLVVVPGTYSVTPSLSGETGSTTTFVVAAAVADDGSTEVPSSSDVRVTTDGLGDVVAIVRAGTKSVSGSFLFVDEDGNAVAAGKQVRIDVDANFASSLLKLNGVKVANGDVVDAVTTAGGKVNFTLEGPAVATNNVVLMATAEGNSSTYTYADFEWQTANYSLVDLNDGDDSNLWGLPESEYRSIAVGGSYTFNFAAVDQWAALATTGTWVVNVAATGNTISTTNHAMTGGKVSVTVTDSKLGSGRIFVDATLKLAGVQKDVKSFELIPSTQTGASITATVYGSPGSTSSTALAAGDSRTSQAELDLVSSTYVCGYVKDSVTEVGRAGVAVTVSGPSSILFADSGTRSAFGSMKVFTWSDGSFCVDMLSNKAQTDTVITITAQDATKTAKVTFSPVAGNTGSAITFSSKKSVQAGRTLIATVFLKDKFGNAVNGGNGDGGNTISLSYDGPGFVFETLPGLLGADGAYTFRVLTSVGDSGPAVFSLTYDVDGALGATAAITGTAATWVGPVANATAGAKKGVVLVDIYRAKGHDYTVLVGKTVVASGTANKANYSVRITGIKSGDRKVTVRLAKAPNFTGTVTVK